MFSQQLNANSWQKYNKHIHILLPRFLYHFSIFTSIQDDAAHFLSASPTCSHTPTHTPSLPRAMQLFIPQPIISSSCLFNLRVAPCISKQVVYPHSSQPSMNPLIHAINISINHSEVSWPGSASSSSIHVFMKRRIKERDGGGSGWINMWKADSEKEKEMIFSCCHVILWKIPFQRHLDFPAFL